MQKGCRGSKGVKGYMNEYTYVEFWERAVEDRGDILGGPPPRVVAIITENGNQARVLKYFYYTTTTAWGVLLSYIEAMLAEV